MFNQKSPTRPTGPVKQLDLDICLAITGGAKAQPQADEASQSPATHEEPQQWLTIPTGKMSMRQWVKQVQSRVVQVSETVKARVAEAGAQMGARMVDIRPAEKRRKAG